MPRLPLVSYDWGFSCGGLHGGLVAKNIRVCGLEIETWKFAAKLERPWCWWPETGLETRRKIKDST